MESITQSAKDLILNSALAPLSTVYTNNLPVEEINNTADTIGLITDVDRQVTTPGNTHNYGMIKSIELQIFWGSDDLPADFNFDDWEIELLRLFKQNNFDIDNIRGNTTDTDTQQTTSTYYFSKYFDVVI